MSKLDLVVVMPVYNEEGAIGKVLAKWVLKLDALGINYQIHPYNDGSRDSTASILSVEAQKYAGRVIVHNKENSGHGPTILQGYREQAPCADWIFQIDSDDEMGPDRFDELWVQRENYDILVGMRDGRLQPLPRKIISAVSRLVVRLFYGKTVWDVNSPYRLMRSISFGSIFQSIPKGTFAPNVILSGCVAQQRLRYFEIIIPHSDRQTGEVSIKKWKLLKAAIKSFCQTIGFAVRNRK